jgi:hypothetical protein
MTDGFRVGFVWKGSKDHKNDRNRSTSLKQWLPLLTMPGVRWYALQQEITAPERQVLDKLPNVTVVEGLKDWGDTAAVLMQLDALATVDSGIAHLAGALGVTTVTLISSTPDFRWGLARTDTPWYGSMRLIRQPKHGAWEPVFQELGARLASVVQDYETRRAA